MVLLMMNISRDDLIIVMPEEEEDGRP